jgi:hypothetical protein
LLLLSALGALLQGDARAAAGEAQVTLYGEDSLLHARNTYSANLRGNFNDLVNRLPAAQRERALAARVVLPLRGRHPLDFFALPEQQAVFVPIESVKLLDDLSVAYAYREERGCDPSAVFDYAGMLSVPDRIATLPRPYQALAIPEGVLDESPAVDDISGKLLKSAVYFLLAHELGHVVLQHPGNASVAPSVSQTHEIEADAFAIASMAEIGVVPVGLIVYLRAASYYETPPSTFDQDQYEEYMQTFSTHPITTARLHALTRAVRARMADFTTENAPALVESVILDIDGIATILSDVQMRRFQRLRSEQRSLASLRSCEEFTITVEPGE